MYPRTTLDPGRPTRGVRPDAKMRIGHGGRRGPILIVTAPSSGPEAEGPRGSGG